MTENVLELDELVMHFGVRGRPRRKHGGRVQAVDGVSLSIKKGNIVALVGESGSGKSTVGRCVVRLLDPTSGTIRLHDADITHLGRRALRPHRRDMAIVFQDPAGSLDPRLPVGGIVSEPLRLLRMTSGRAERERAVDAALRRVGLSEELSGRYPHELSGGQRQRVSLARALASNPSLLIADEPTSALDVSVQAAVLNLLGDLQRDLGFGCLLITHDLSAVEYLADEIAVMYLGKLVEYGPSRAVFDTPHHPYTQALLAAAPIPDPERQRRRGRVLLGGDIPSAIDPPSGCRFHTRCPLATDVCVREVPEPRELPDGTKVACHLVDDDGTGPDVRDSTA